MIEGSPPGVIKLYGVRGIAAENSVFGDVDHHVFFLTNRRKRNGDGAVGGVYTADEASDALFLPFFALAGLFIGNVRLFHRDDGGSQDCFSIAVKIAADENAVARLQIGQGHRRSVFQVFLTGGDADELRTVLHQNGHVASGIGRQRNGIPRNRLNRSNGTGGGLRLRCRHLPTVNQ